MRASSILLLSVFLITALSCKKDEKKTDDIPAKDDPAKEKPAEEKPAKDEPAKDKPAKDTPAVSDEFSVYGPLERGADLKSLTKLSKAPYFSKTHGKRFVETYVNEKGLAAYKDDDADIPIGAVVVKTSWENKDDKPTEVAGPVFVMERRAGKDGAGEWWYALHWAEVPAEWQDRIGGKQIYWRSPSPKVAYCVDCHENFPRELGGIPKDSRNYK